MASPAHSRGLTLIEILTVLVVLAIVAAIALPGYRGEVLRTHRTEATAALLRIGAAQEAHFLQHNRYAASLTAPPPLGLDVSPVTERGHYELTIDLTTANGSGFIARARPRAATGQRGDALCSEFRLDHTGQRGASDAAAADSTAACWR